MKLIANISISLIVVTLINCQAYADCRSRIPSENYAGTVYAFKVHYHQIQTTARGSQCSAPVKLTSEGPFLSLNHGTGTLTWNNTDCSFPPCNTQLTNVKMIKAQNCGFWQNVSTVAQCNSTSSTSWCQLALKKLQACPN